MMKVPRNNYFDDNGINYREENSEVKDKEDDHEVKVKDLDDGTTN